MADEQVPDETMAEEARNRLMQAILLQASLFQEAWQLQLESWDGALAQAQRHGWSQEQARMLIFGMLMKQFGLA